VNNPSLAEIEDLARRAGEILRAGYNPIPGAGNPLQIAYKGEIDLVTDVDRRSEAFILEHIKTRYPHDRVVAEESGTRPGDNDRAWYVDPLDGTVNYAHSVPLFAVSIGYQAAGELQLGVVYDPIHDECFTGQRGEGAWLNGDRLRVSDTQDLLHSLLVTGFPYDIRTNPHNNLNNYAQLSLVSQGVRRLGAASLDVCYVAAGRLEGYWEIETNAWDIAAGSLIVLEAGGYVTDLAGRPDYLAESGSLLAANPGLHAKMLAILMNGRG
jgi:myo-inositol-1(or 4)-monophosphatase